MSACVQVIRVWRPKQRGNGYTAKKIIRNAHSNAITDIGLHPTGDILGSASIDGTWAVHQLGYEGAMRSTPGGSEHTGGLRSFAFHPDGAILATGGGAGDGRVKIWTLSERTVAATLSTAHGDSRASTATPPLGAVCGLSFSENGYHLATAHDRNGSSPSCVKVWDLRKQRCLATMGGDGDHCSAHFDSSGGPVMFHSDLNSEHIICPI